ncbi:MAG TPA: VWA domain-containing protein [Candidatus Limnocylindrales bacterium]|nr:VWA domain-containing protein [Candidatus Limnocylindrales bacterium]
MLDPGTSQVSFLKTELTYDATKFQVDEGGFQVNQDAFPKTLQGPFYSPGKVSFAISIGGDGTQAIQSTAKVGTLTLRALSSSGISQVGYSAGAQALSIDPNSTPTENVISNTTPAFLVVSGTTTVAPTSPPNACTSVNPSDTMLVIDKSGSMSVAADVNKISQAKIAAKNYVDIISQQTSNTIGLVSYENTATVNSPLTTDYASVKSQIDTLTAIGSTCTECGILKANQEIAKSNSANKKVVVLLTDGIANFVEGDSNQVATALAEQRAVAAAVAGNAAKGTVFYTIGLGQQINAQFLQQIANATGGKYFASPTGDQLNAIYQQISVIAAQGSVSGIVFNDANNNRAYETTEAKLAGWTLQLTGGGSTTPQTFISDITGFNITGLCNGTYTLKEVVQSGWRQTLPTDPNGYTFIITNGNVITDQNFGNNRGNTCADGIDNNNNSKIDIADPVCHTDGNPANPDSYDPTRPETGNTCADRIDNNNNNLIDTLDPICHTDGNKNNPNSYDPNLPERTGNTCADGIDNNGNNLVDGLDPICHNGGVITNPYNPDLPESGGNGTGLSLTLFLHGIGNSGDNANPTGISLSNKNPLKKTRPATVQIYDISNKIFATASGTLTYSSASGNYSGRVQTTTALPSANYNLRVEMDQHLARRIPGTQLIKANIDNPLPDITLVTGDIDNNNKLNILDYNLLLDCYSDTQPAPSCAENSKKIQSDINDDGPVNGTDYNLFIRELSVQPGE